MTVVDFIDVIDDIIDLSSDEETVQQEHIATWPQATLLDRQAVFVLADEGRQDTQAAFVPAGEGSQEATESGNALVATTSPSVMEKAPLDMAESQNCPSSPTSAPLPSLTSTTPRVLFSEVGGMKQEVFVLAGEGRQDAQAAFVSAGEGGLEATESGNALVITTSPSVMGKVSHDMAESKNCPTTQTSVPLPSPTSTTPKALTSEVGDTQLVATALPSVMEKAPLDMVESQNCPSSPTSAPLPSPTSITPNVLSSEVGGTKQEVFVLSGEGRQDAQAAFVSAGEENQEATGSGKSLVTTISSSVMGKTPLDMAESKNCPISPTLVPLPSPTSTTPKALTSEVCDTQLVATASPSVMEKAPLDTAEPKNCPSSSASASVLGLTSTTLKAPTSEVGDTKLVRVRHPKKNYHNGTPRRSTRFEQKRECCNNPLEELAADHKRSRMLESAEESAAPADNTECPTFTTSKAPTSEDGDARLVRVKHPKKNYHTGTPRRSPRLQQKRECCNSPVEELAANHKRSRMLEPAEESAASTNNAESTNTLSTDSAN